MPLSPGEIVKQSTVRECEHPPRRLYAGHAYNAATGKNDLLWVGCCKCGQIIHNDPVPLEERIKAAFNGEIVAGRNSDRACFIPRPEVKA